jgi:uncharacterized integral membrane protein
VRFLIWGLRLLILLFLFAFALKNSEDVSLNFFFGEVWALPLSLLLLITLVLGVVLGITAMLMPFFRARREATRLRRELEKLSAANPPPPAAPPILDAAPHSALSGFSIFPPKRSS